jgi:hypothetical protein
VRTYTKRRVNFTSPTGEEQEDKKLDNRDSPGTEAGKMDKEIAPV